MAPGARAALGGRRSRAVPGTGGARAVRTASGAGGAIPGGGRRAVPGAMAGARAVLDYAFAVLDAFATFAKEGGRVGGGRVGAGSGGVARCAR
ncbi:hypothetical protein [Streptomyces fradiae]|uniref:hypothetical protein n=1 Tax=Streptomyces fradiae TaxID=1906 RepID=UPI0035BE9DED